MLLLAPERRGVRDFSMGPGHTPAIQGGSPLRRSTVPSRVPGDLFHLHQDLQAGPEGDVRPVTQTRARRAQVGSSAKVAR